jgi:hypothetical protein
MYFDDPGEVCENPVKNYIWIDKAAAGHISFLGVNPYKSRGLIKGKVGYISDNLRIGPNIY